MTVTLELSDEEAEKMAECLASANTSYWLMAMEARKAGDSIAYSDFRAEAEVASDLRERVLAGLNEEVSDASYLGR